MIANSCADINSVENDHESPIFDVGCNGDTCVLRELIELDANSNVRTDHGETLLYWAILYAVTITSINRPTAVLPTFLVNLPDPTVAAGAAAVMCSTLCVFDVP